MRNEHASVPYLAPIARLMPRTLAADFTHQIIGRDYLFQTLLDGVPAPDGLAAYPRPEWASFFRQLGAITRRILRGAPGDTRRRATRAVLPDPARGHPSARRAPAAWRVRGRAG